MFWVLWALILLGLNVTFQLLTIEPVPWRSAAILVILEFFWLGLAYEITEAIVTCLQPPYRAQRLTQIDSLPPVALVCCTCDDTDRLVLKQLGRQTYPAVTIFILDDSTSEWSRNNVDRTGFIVVRRNSRHGFKAGNLNNWLREYGERYEFLVVADADTLLPSTFVANMVAYALHPTNAHVAIFESLIQAWNTRTLFGRWQRSSQRVRHQVALSVDNHIGTTMSVGHNDMYRTGPLLAIGGFQEAYVAEDFATCVEILRGGDWACLTVPLQSYERVPVDVYQYCRRQSRWAAQTLQLCRLSLHGVAWPVRVRLLRGLQYYASYFVIAAGAVWLAVAALTGANAATVSASTSGQTAFAVAWIGSIYLPSLLRWLIARGERVTTTDYLGSVALETALFSASLGPVLDNLISRGRSPICFEPTGSARPSSPRTSIAMACGTVGLGSTGSVLVALGLTGGLNAVWSLPLLLAPLFLAALQRSRRCHS